MSWVGPIAAMLAVVVLALRWAPTPAARDVGRTEVDPAADRPRWQRRRRARPITDVDMAAWCEHVARGVRAGRSLTRAIEDGASLGTPAARAMDPVRHAVRRGRPIHEALVELAPDASSPIGLVVPVLSSCAELGGPAAAPLDRVAATLQARAAERAERVTSSAQARMSARVLTTLPIGMLGLLAVAEPSVRASVGTAAGLVCVVLGGLCNLVGWWWMRRITWAGLS